MVHFIRWIATLLFDIWIYIISFWAKNNLFISIIYIRYFLYFIYVIIEFLYFISGF